MLYSMKHQNEDVLPNAYSMKGLRLIGLYTRFWEEKTHTILYKDSIMFALIYKIRSITQNLDLHVSEVHDIKDVLHLLALSTKIEKYWLILEYKSIKFSLNVDNLMKKDNGTNMVLPYDEQGVLFVHKTFN